MKDQPPDTRTQASDSARNTVDSDRNQTVDFDRLMPGLVPQLVDAFNRPNSHLTVRGAARRKKVPEIFVSTALFRDLYAEVHALRRIVGMRSGVSQGLQVVRKSA